MFTGLIEGLAVVCDVRNVGDAMDLDLDLGGIADGVRVGDSVALSGACCTVTHVAGTVARFWLSGETLHRTWFASLAVGSKLNLERCLRAGQPMGGHIVQGHVDGVGRVVRPVGPAGGTWEVELPQVLVPYCVDKGSIALEGVSLTIAGCSGPRVAVAIIPHTATHTTIGGLHAGSAVNVEVDILAKYVERLLAARRDLPRP